jgi:hypothetical protein
MQAENKREISQPVLICVHAPTDNSDNTVTEQFFEDLQRIQDRSQDMMQQ